MEANTSELTKEEQETEQILKSIGGEYRKQIHTKGEIKFAHSERECRKFGDVEIGIMGPRHRITIETYARGREGAQRSSAKRNKNPHKNQSQLLEVE